MTTDPAGEDDGSDVVGVDQKLTVWSYDDGGHRRWAAECAGCDWLLNGRSNLKVVLWNAGEHLMSCDKEG